MAVAAKALRPDVRIIGVQAAGAAAFPPSLVAGEPVRLPIFSTIADGIAVGRPGELTFNHVRKLVDEVVTVSEEDISRALLMLLERGKQVVEPAGRGRRGRAAGGRGRGGDAGGGGALRRQHRPAADAAGDRARARRRRSLPAGDRALLGPARGSSRRCSARSPSTGPTWWTWSTSGPTRTCGLGEVEVALSVETRGVEHSDTLISALRASGYQVVFAGEA